MPIAVYSFPKSGNYFVTRSFACTIEANIYHTLCSQNIVDLHVRRSLSLKSIRRNSNVYLPENVFGKRDVLKSENNFNMESSDYIIYKSHSLRTLLPLCNKIDCIFVILRRPTDILRSHVQFQYTAVRSLDAPLMEHSKYVYLDQRFYMDKFMMLRPSLEYFQDSYLQVIINATCFKLPIFITTFDSFAENPWLIISNFSHAVYGKKIIMPINFEQKIAKDNFLSAQEKIFNHSICDKKWRWDKEKPFDILNISRWAYENNFRLITPNNSISSLLRSLPKASFADSIYDIVSQTIPTHGLYLTTQKEKDSYKNSILNKLSNIGLGYIPKTV